MRPHVPSLALILSSLTATEAAAYERRNHGLSGKNLAESIISIINNIGGSTVTVTETVRQTITVGGGGAVGGGMNSTAVMTVTVTAPASSVDDAQQATVTVTVCPDQGQGAIESGRGGESAVITSGSEAITTLPVPTDAVGSQPVVSQPGAGLGNSTSIAPQPTEPAQSQPVTSLPATSSLEAPPRFANSSSVPIVGAPISRNSTSLPASSTVVETSSSSSTSKPAETSSSPSTSTSAPLPGIASSLSSTLNLGGTTSAAVPTEVAMPSGAFGGVVSLIPMESAEIPVQPPAVTPGVANGAGGGISIDLSSLTLSSQLNLGNLARQTAAAAA